MNKDLHSKDLGIKTENYTISKIIPLPRELNSKDIEEIIEGIESIKVPYAKITITHEDNTYSVHNLNGLIGKSNRITINIVPKIADNGSPNQRMIEQDSYWFSAEFGADSLAERIENMLDYHS